MAQLNVRHNAPAGGTYPSIQQAGRSTLMTYCDNYPNTTSSFLLPNLFLSSFPDVIDNPKAGLTAKQKKQLDGFANNLAGEREEYDIYQAFTSIAAKSPADPILVFWGTKFDSDNSRAIKRNTLRSELPSISFGPGEMSQEKDFIIFVRNYGVVFGEVKKSATEVNIEKAEEQLGNAEHLFQKIMYAISGPNGPVLPTAKMIIVPNESGPSPTTKTPFGSHFVYNDLLQNFEMKWGEMVDELKVLNAINPINSSDFEKLAQIMTGIWSMKAVQKKFFHFSTDEASLALNVQKVDKIISTASLCSEKGAQFSSNISTSSISEMCDRDEELNVLYFSPQQRLFFDDFPQALIRAHAGCGKTLLILIKILEILEKDPTQKILLIAGKPHHLRCKRILQRNNVTTYIFRLFPNTLYSPQASFRSSAQVVIVELQKFFQVARNTLMAYDFSEFNVFIDDLHGYNVPLKGDFSDFSDVGDFIDKTYSVAKLNNMFCWFGLDAGQQHFYKEVMEKKVLGLFFTKNGSERSFSIPVVVLNQVLRNSKEIVTVLESARREQAKGRNLDTSLMITNIECGHHITSQKLLYHRLEHQQVFFQNNEAQTKFACARIEELFRMLSSSDSSSSSSSSASSTQSFCFASVAILFESEGYLSNYKSALEQMLLTTFNLGVQSIERKILNNKHTHVTMDHIGNAQSFETPVLVYVRIRGGTVYNIVSRSRTICMIIDVNSSDPLPLQNVDIVDWKESNGVFTRLI